MRLAQNPHERVYEIQRPFPVKIIINDTLICTYEVDFFVTYSDDLLQLQRFGDVAVFF